MTTVRTATVGDRPELLAVLRRAFVDDPAVAWFVGGTAPARRRAFFRLSVSRSTLALGGCDLTEGGGAVWFPPGAYGTAVHAALLELPLALAAFGTRIGTASRADAEMRRRHPAQPHWYLNLIGVEPDRAGRGIGSALLTHRLPVIDAEHAGAYLESSSMRNVPLYERFGFVVTDEVRFVPGAPPVWPMWRAPRP